MSSNVGHGAGLRPYRSWDVIDVSALAGYVEWNAPDYEHVRLTMRRILERELDEAIEAHTRKARSE